MIRVETPFGLIAVGTKVLNTRGVMAPGGLTIVNVATAATGLCPLFVCSAPTGTVLTCGPSQSVVVTTTLTVQEPLAGIEPPVKIIFDEPLTAVTTPPQVLLALPLTIMSSGNWSTSGAVSMSTVLPELCSVRVRSDVEPILIVAGLKAFVRVGATTGIGVGVGDGDGLGVGGGVGLGVGIGVGVGVGGGVGGGLGVGVGVGLGVGVGVGDGAGVVTVKVATAGAVLLPLSVFKSPAPTELMKLPGLAAITCTLTVQDPLAGIAPPVSVTDELPASAITVPPQVLLAFGVGATTTPVGRLSTSGAFRLAIVSLALFNVRVSVEVPPAVIVAGVNALPTVGGMGVTGGATQAAKDT